MERTELTKPLIVKPRENQAVIILPPKSLEKFKRQRVEVTGTRISVEPSALDTLGEKVKIVAKLLPGVQGKDYSSELEFQFASVDWRPLVQELRREKRSAREIFKEIYDTLEEGGLGFDKAASQARTMYEKLVEFALEIPKNNGNRSFTKRSVW